ncbi:MAG: SAM-dependent chlorinase/fluorinase [Acidobacteria bacterium]|nr:SAM-dependent chlorinase/fluorinase [Acidobacteriota bacterium]MCA1641630.1 SAM-dependent chlorinase/fluorinase [Acidobacteriota bacterium]
MIITLLTDFGTADYFVGALKGVILSANPRATVVDITHEIPAHDVQAGAFTLLAASESFPAGTIHVGVVDPGVGSARRAILAECGGQRFVGPDNGLFSYVCERAGSAARVRHLTNRKFFRKDVSATFHGRDVFAPVAAALSAGAEPREFGEEMDDWVRLASLAPRAGDGGAIEATIIHVDRFGNCVTNLTRRELSDERIARGATLVVGDHTVRSIRRFYADGAGDSPEPFAIWGSAGFLEISAPRASAARLLRVRRGQTVLVSPES